MAESQALTEAGISEREAEVLALVGAHLTNAQIAGRLVISVRTVESHVSSLLRKLDMSDRRALAELAPRLAARDDVPPTARIPAPLTSFIGRVAERAELAEAVAQHRLVTAVGPGGVGKTRLAVAVAGEVTERFAHGAWYVDLVPVTDPAMVGAAVATVLGYGEQLGRSPTETLVAKLAATEALIILDNCEHLLEGVIELVETLLRACPQVTVLATSRTRLQLPFEYVFHVPGLSLAEEASEDSDAVRLFVDRAAMAGWSTRYPDDRRRIASICERLEGVALAIELAAARVATLGLDGLESGLTSPLAVLTGGPRLEERHRSVRSALDWSFGLLSGEDQVVLRRTSVFAAPFLASAAATVAGFAPLTDEAVTQALARLADNNLVVVLVGPRGTRYRMLETIRQYGDEQMDQVAEQDDVRRRHLDWCLETAAQLQDSASDLAFDEVVDDLRAGLGWAATQPSCRAEAHGLASRLAQLTYVHGMPSEAQRRYEQAATLTEDADEAHRALRLAAAVAWGRQSGNETFDLNQAAADAARRAGDSRAAALDLARAAEILTRATGLMSTLPPAGTTDRLLAQAQELALGDPLLEAATLTAIGSANPYDTSSGEFLQRAAELAGRLGDARIESAALDGITSLHLAQSNTSAAVEVLERRLALVSPLADQPEMAWEYTDVFHMAPLVHLMAGNIPVARRYAQQRRALRFFGEAEHLAVVWSLTTEAVAGDLNAAAEFAERFKRGWEEAGQPTRAGYAFCPAAASMVYGVRGHPSARAEWREISAQMRSAVSGRLGNDTAYLRTFDGITALHTGDLSEAQEATSRDPESFRTWQDGAWRQWYTAVWAETAVLAELPDRQDRLGRARFITAGNPCAAALVERADALAAGDAGRVVASAEALERVGCLYQAARSLVLAGQDEGRTRMEELGASSMDV